MPLARSGDGVLMGMRHRSLPYYGVQFHPESVLTPSGPQLLANFLELCGEIPAGTATEAGRRVAAGILPGGVAAAASAAGCAAETGR